MDCPAARALVDDGLADRAFSAASLEVGTRAQPVWRYAAGRLSSDPHAAAASLDTVFDLASLTKVIATTSLAMRHIGAGRLTLDSSIADLLPNWTDPRHAAITVRHLLDHSSGLPAHVRFWERLHGRAPMEAAIRQLTLEHPPGLTSVYSDPGFILLGLVLEHVARSPLDVQFAAWRDAWPPLSPDDTSHVHAIRYQPPAEWRARTASTEFDPWRRRVLVGEVHDENAAALDGVAGHAGLFGTAPAVGGFARLVMETFERETSLGPPELMRRFATPTGVPGSSRALGWDTMLPTSSCGTRLSRSAIGHTGFTGTSLWIDAARDLYVVLLTNRVHPTRQNDRLTRLRPRIHDAIVEAFDSRGDAETPTGD